MKTKTEVKYKAVAYAYPTSEHATQFGFAKHGCYVVETSSNADRIPRAIAGFATRKEAFALLDQTEGDELYCIPRPMLNP